MTSTALPANITSRSISAGSDSTLFTNDNATTVKVASHFDSVTHQWIWVVDDNNQFHLPPARRVYLHKAATRVECVQFAIDYLR